MEIGYRQPKLLATVGKVFTIPQRVAAVWSTVAGNTTFSLWGPGEPDSSAATYTITQTHGLMPGILFPQGAKLKLLSGALLVAYEQEPHLDQD